MKKFRLLTTLVVLFSTLSLAAPVGTKFNYQGQLVENGVAVSGSYTFQFKLYEDESGPVDIAVMAEMTGVPVSNGLFSVELDFGDIHFDGEEVYLEINVKEDGQAGLTTLSPRQRINTVPYAIQSQFVENSSSPWQDVTGGIGYTQDVKVGNVSTLTASMFTVDSAGSPVRFKVDGSTKMVINTNGGTSLGNNTSAPDNGLRVEGVTRLIGDTEMLGELKQQADNNGAIKAGVNLLCSNNPTITNSFNGVNTSAITTSVGADTGRCRINFPFDLSDRYFVAMYRSSSSANSERRLVTCDQGGPSIMDCAVSTLSGTAVDSNINILVY